MIKTDYFEFDGRHYVIDYDDGDIVRHIKVEVIGRNGRRHWRMLTSQANAWKVLNHWRASKTK